MSTFRVLTRVDDLSAVPPAVRDVLDGLARRTFGCALDTRTCTVAIAQETAAGASSRPTWLLAERADRLRPQSHVRGTGGELASGVTLGGGAIVDEFRCLALERVDVV